MPEELIAFFSMGPSNILIDLGGIALKCGALDSVLADEDALSEACHSSKLMDPRSH